MSPNILKLLSQVTALRSSLNLEMPDRKRAFMEISIGSQVAGEIQFELFSDVVPRTAENFLGYINGHDSSGKKLVDPDGLAQHYLGGEFRRVIPGFMAQGVLPVNFNFPKHKFKF